MAPLKRNNSAPPAAPPKRQQSESTASVRTPRQKSGTTDSTNEAPVRQGKALEQWQASSLDDPGTSFQSTASDHTVSSAERGDETIKKIELMRLQLERVPEQAQALLDSLATEQEGFCRLSKLKPTKEGGYIQLSWKGANKFAILQEVMLWAKGMYCPYGMHISHLCDNPRCVIKEHVIIETPQQNNSRKNCGQTIQCAHCDKLYLACKHSPPCITFVEKFGTWDEFLEQGTH